MRKRERERGSKVNTRYDGGEKQMDRGRERKMERGTGYEEREGENLTEKRRRRLLHSRVL